MPVMLPLEIVSETLHFLDLDTRECLRLVSCRFNTALLTVFKSSPFIIGTHLAETITFDMHFQKEGLLAEASRLPDYHHVRIRRCTSCSFAYCAVNGTSNASCTRSAPTPHSTLSTARWGGSSAVGWWALERWTSIALRQTAMASAGGNRSPPCSSITTAYGPGRVVST